MREVLTVQTPARHLASRSELAPARGASRRGGRNGPFGDRRRQVKGDLEDLHGTGAVMGVGDSATSASPSPVSPDVRLVSTWENRSNALSM